VEQPSVRILVVVAIIQVKTSLEGRSKEKGSMSTANGHGLVGPKKRGKPVQANMVGLISWVVWEFHPRMIEYQIVFTPGMQDTARSVSKGKQVNIPVPSLWTDCL